MLIETVVPTHMAGRILALIIDEESTAPVFRQLSDITDDIYHKIRAEHNFVVLEVKRGNTEFNHHIKLMSPCAENIARFLRAYCAVHSEICLRVNQADIRAQSILYDVELFLKNQMTVELIKAPD